MTELDVLIEIAHVLRGASGRLHSECIGPSIQLANCVQNLGNRELAICAQRQYPWERDCCQQER